jgi:hypothetical protein
MMRFYGDFEGYWDILREFEEPEETLMDSEVIFADYERGQLEGEAMVVFLRDDSPLGNEPRLYCVHASHCSCRGLEGQWEPEETTIKALVFTMLRGEGVCWMSFYYHRIRDDLFGDLCARFPDEFPVAICEVMQMPEDLRLGFPLGDP